MFPKLFFISILSSLVFIAYSYSQCLHHQKTVLLQLKNELIFEFYVSTKLVQWNQTDNCCNWPGVECDAAGNVISLQLDDEGIYGEIGNSSSLFQLVHLEKLNLAYNFISNTPIPKGIQNLTYLTHLNLSNAAFGGQVPSEISSLRRLVSLDISYDENWHEEQRILKKYPLPVEMEPLSLEEPNLEMLVQNLTGLRELYLDGVNIISSDERSKWSHIISSYLPHLTTLSLADCSLSGPLARSFSKLHSLSILRLDGNDLLTIDFDLFANLSSLSTLSLRACGLNGFFPNRIFKIPTLQNLDLSFNWQLSGSIVPPITQSESLKSLVLRNTNLSGFIPSSINNLKALSHLDLFGCKFTGSLPSTLANLTQLTYVDLSYNFFTGSLSSTLSQGLSNLVYLNLVDNSFTGYIPESLFRLPLDLYLYDNQFKGLVEDFRTRNVSKIVSLDLMNNRLEGPIPDSLFQLESLEYLLLSNNLLNGTFELDKIQSLVNLKLLQLSYNNLSIDVGNHGSSRYELPQLQDLRLASCNLNDFPEFIKHSNISYLDLSNNRIGGEIPSWIWGTQLVRLDLSYNLLTDLQKPYHIPTSLFILNLHSNKLRGEVQFLIPQNIENYAPNLGHLLLGNNSFSGSIPTSLCSATQLFVLDLSHNNLSGNIPSCAFESIRVFDVGGNKFSGHIPDIFPDDCRLTYFDVSNNTFEGKIPQSLRSCKWLEFMNVGNNNINDSFPCMLSSALRFLVLRSNRFHGEVRCQMSWPDLQIVDISSNSFNGNLESVNFSGWKEMVSVDNHAQPRDKRFGSYFTPLVVGATNYTVGIRLVMKGHDVELVNIWPEFTVIDFSGNNFGGEIPNSIGDLSLLYLLNLSHNALNGSIPKSFGQLRNLESLDLSRNRLTGPIPVELAGLSFLSVLNLSYNKLVGMIPNSRQFQTFSADSFKGNPGLCGFNLNISCSDSDSSDHLWPQEDENGEEKSEIEWEYVSAAVGYVVGLGIIVWLLLFSRSFREKYFGKVEEVFEDIRVARRRRHARRVVKNQVRRQ